MELYVVIILGVFVAIGVFKATPEQIAGFFFVGLMLLFGFVQPVFWLALGLLMLWGWWLDRRMEKRRSNRAGSMGGE